MGPFSNNGTVSIFYIPGISYCRRGNQQRRENRNGLLFSDGFRGLLRELPSLPSQNAILLGWASELPVMVKMNDLSDEERPHSDDPDFWDVWTGKNSKGEEVRRDVDWKKIADEWQGRDGGGQ